MSTAVTTALRPLYGQVRDEMLSRIGSGRYAPGDTLPNEIVLAAEFDVSIGTVRRAFDELQNSGIIVRKQGRGTYVSGRGTRALENRFTGLRSESGAPLELTYQLVSLIRRTASAAEQSRFVARGTLPVFEVQQRVLCGGRTVGVENSLVPVTLFPSLEGRVGVGRSLYALYSELGVLVTWAEDRLRTASARADDPFAHGWTGGQPTLVVERIAGSLDLRRVELKSAVYDGNAVSYCFTI